MLLGHPRFLALVSTKTNHRIVAKYDWLEQYHMESVKNSPL